MKRKLAKDVAINFKGVTKTFVVLIIVFTLSGADVPSHSQGGLLQRLDDIEGRIHSAHSRRAQLNVAREAARIREENAGSAIIALVSSNRELIDAISMTESALAEKARIEKENIRWREEFGAIEGSSPEGSRIPN